VTRNFQKALAFLKIGQKISDKDVLRLNLDKIRFVFVEISHRLIFLPTVRLQPMLCPARTQ